MRRHRWWHAPPAALVGAALFAAAATTPSLIPRDWLFQGLASGVTGAAGYAVGVVLAALLRRSQRWRSVSHRLRVRLGERGRVVAWRVLLVALVVGLGTVLAVSAGWQREVAELTGASGTSTSRWFRGGALMVIIVAVLVGATRTLRRLPRAVGIVLHRRLRLPRGLSVVAAVVITALVVVTVVNQVVARAALSVADAAFEAADEVVAPDVAAPTAATRSGSPTSLVAWSTLGVEGRAFVTGGRGRAELAAASGHPSRPAVRAYVGLDSAATPRARARLAVAELVRTGGFNRSVVVVTTGSGTGWVNPTALDAVELMYGGDTATVATQYSYLPSALSLLVDRTRAEQAGRLLFDDVSAHVEAMPPDRRPKVLVFGESLGVLGGEAAFPSLADVRAHADGVLWTGPPSESTLWSSLVARRDPGSREVLPVYDDGLVVRFAARPSGAAVPHAPWLAPRVLYLQHSSDPIVWWSPSLILRRPDWLAEPRGADVSPDVRWYPLVTFWQLTVDLAHSQSVPDGHGHNYGDEVLPAWAQVAPPPGWTPADTARALVVLRR